MSPLIFFLSSVSSHVSPLMCYFSCVFFHGSLSMCLLSCVSPHFSLFIFHSSPAKITTLSSSLFTYQQNFSPMLTIVPSLSRTKNRKLMTQALSFERLRPGTWPEAAVARTEFHLSQILKQQQDKNSKESKEADELASRARTVLTRLLKTNPLEGVTAEDELALFDHLQPVFDGRFTGRELLKYVSSSTPSPNASS